MEGVTTRPCGNNNRPTSAQHAEMRDEIVWTAWRHAEAGHKQSSDNISPYSGKLEALSKFEARKPVMQALRNDAVKTFDRAAWAQFKATPLHVVPASAGTSTATLTLTTNGTATATNNIVFQKEHAKLVVDLMKERNIPGAANDRSYSRGLAA